MTSALMNYYQAIEKASQDMLDAARAGNWDHVLKLEGACALLISQLKSSAARQPLGEDELQFKSRIMQRILINDAEIVGSSRVDLQACKLEYSIVSPK